MPRNEDGIFTAVWAESGDTETPADAGITETSGWGTSYSTAGGDLPSRELFNYLFLRLYALGVDLNAHGLLEWHADTPFEHPALTFGSDGVAYISKQDSQGEDPTTDTTETYWESFGQVADGSIGTDQLENLAVTAGKLAALAVSTGKLANLAVTTGKIAADAVTNAKLADDAVDSDQIVAGAVDLAHLATFVLTAAYIPDLDAGKITTGRFPRERLPATLSADDVDGTSVWTGTEAQYDALGSPDANTLYVQT